MTPNTAVATSGGGGSGSGNGSDGGLKKGPWTASEDAILMEYVRKHGEGNWNAVQRNSGLNRCGKSCRLRWANHLRPNLKKGAFSHDEERLILELHAKYGNKWARMAAQLPGRTDNEIKNYWNTRVKRRQRQGLPLYPHDIQPQSQPTTPTSPIPLSAITSSSTPTTPTGSTIFHFHNHSPIHSLSSTPTPLSPLSSPHHHDHTFSSFPLMPTNTFTFHRPPPILGTPVRFKHFRNSPGFSHPMSLSPQRSPTVLVQNPSPPHFSRVDSFQFPMTTAANSPQILQSQFKSDGMIMSNCINSVKPELPSSQFHQNIHNNALSFNDAKISSAMTFSSGSGLLEDMLEEAQSLTCDVNSSKSNSPCLVSHEQHRLFDGFNKLEDNSNSAYLFLSSKPKEEGGDNQGNTTNEDWSKLLNGIPTNMQVPQWYNNKEEEISYGQASGLAADDENVGLDVQHIASLFPVTSEPDQSGRTNTTCPWDNLPGIC